MNSCVIIFARNPELGNVKSRIAQEVGEKTALQIYLQLFEHCLQVSSSEHWERVLYLAEPHVHGLVQQWADHHGLRLAHQCDGDLGQRMATAIAQELDHYDNVCIIGTDCPSLDAKVLASIFAHLENNHVVIQAACDGGYVALACCKLYPVIFQDIVWGGPEVLEQTRHRLQQHTISHAILPGLQDIDYYQDFLHFFPNQQKN